MAIAVGGVVGLIHGGQFKMYSDRAGMWFGSGVDFFVEMGFGGKAADAFAWKQSSTRR
jgi:hypothetical protein